MAAVLLAGLGLSAVPPRVPAASGPRWAAIRQAQAPNRRPPRRWRAEALTVDAAALSTVSPEPRGSLRLTTTVAGAPLAVEASGVRLLPLAGRARITLRDVDATLANLYLPPDTAVALEKALIGAAVDA